MTPQLLQPAVDVEVSSARYYRPELDALRAFAFFVVFLSHVSHSLLRYGRCGVNLFFVLSSFLICELLLREKEATKSVNVRNFYIRRALRIWPVYYLVLVTSVAISIALKEHIPHLLTNTAWYAVFCGPLFGELTHRSFLHPAGHLWSISTEEQFYLLFPWVVRFMSRRYLYVVCVAIVLASDSFMWIVGNSYPYLGGNTLVLFQAFAAGIAICLIVRGSVFNIPLYGRALLSIFGLCLWVIAMSLKDWIAAQSLMTIGACCLLLSFYRIGSIPNWSIYLGRRSYGMYAYHVFAIVIVGHVLKNGILSASVALALTILAAHLSYRFFELRFLKLKDRFTVVKSLEA